MAGLLESIGVARILEVGERERGSKRGAAIAIETTHWRAVHRGAAGDGGDDAGLCQETGMYEETYQGSPEGHALSLR
jgi:hypothetical protein